MYRNQRYGGGGNYNNGYMGDWGGGWQGGGMNNMGWNNMGGNIRNRKRGGFDMGGPMYDGPYVDGPPAKMMRMEMGGGFRRYGNKGQKRWGGKKSKESKDAMKMADAIIEKHGGGAAKKNDAAGKAGGSTNTGDKRKNRHEKVKKNPYHCHFCKVDTLDKKSHSEHIKSPGHGSSVKKREFFLLEMMNVAYEMSQRDVYNARMSGRRIRFCSGCYLQFTGDPERHKKTRSHKNMEFNLRVRCTDCDCLQPTRLQYEKHLTSQQHIRNQMYRMIEDGKTDYDNLDCPEEFEEGVDVGNHYVVDLKAIFCKVCDKMVPSRKQNAISHCKTEEHFNNFKAFAEVEKVERVKRKEEEEQRKKEEEERKLLEAEEAAEEGDKEEDGEKEEADGEEEADEEMNNEESGEAEAAAAEEAEAAAAEEAEEAAAEEAEEAAAEEAEATEEAAAEEVTEEPEKEAEETPAEPEEAEPPKRGRATRRSTRK